MIDYLKKAREVIDIEIEGLKTIRDELGESFEKLVELAIETLRNGGKLVLSGVGKSGHIAHKLVATLSSTGSPSAFLNPVEAMHGDLGMVSTKDMVIALSYSGETDELLVMLPAVKRFGIKIVAITASTDCRLSEYSDLTVTMKVPREACPYNLAPTTTTTSLLALGDALAIVLLSAKKFTKEDYGKFHPGGAIGRSVTLRIEDIMRKEDKLVLVSPERSVSEVIMEMTKKRSGSAMIVDASNTLLGIFTDGDFRRHAPTRLVELMQSKVSEVMTVAPVTINHNSMAVELMNMLEKKHIDDIPVVDDAGKAVGVVDIQDLPRFKLM